MNRLILASLLALLPGVAAANGGFTFGAGVGGFVPYEEDAYGAGATRLLDNLGARAADDTVNGFSFGLSQTLPIMEVLQIQLRERLWMHTAGGDFAHNPELDFERTTMVVPLTAGLRLALDGRYVGFRLGAGAGGYLVDIEESGHLGNREQTSVEPGGYVSGALAFLFGDSGVGLQLEFTHDWVELPELNPLFQDGGEGGGSSVGVSLEFALGGDD